MDRKHILGLFIVCISLAGINLPTNVIAVGESFTFAAAADFNRGPEDSRTGPLLDRLQASGVDFLLAIGDMGYGENEQEWCTWTKAHYNNILVITGNHETDESGPSDIGSDATYCPFPLNGISVNGAPGYPMGGYGFAYYFDYPAASPLARFILVPFGNTGCVSEVVSFCFDHQDWEPGNSGHTWLSNAVNSAKAGGMWTVVGFHEDCISSDWRGCDTSGDYVSQEEFDMLFRLGVDLVLHAHNHVYERSKQLKTSAACPTILADLPGDADCIVDATSPYVRGAGTVVVNQGTGGAGLYDVQCGSLYYAAAMDDLFACGGTGTGADGRGALLYTVTSTSISGRTDFDTSYSDSFEVISCTTTCPLSASFSFTPTNPLVGEQVAFSATASGGTPPYSFSWDFGDGSTGVGESLVHTYSAENTYTVSLTTSDAASGIANAQGNIVVGTITPPPSLTATFTHSPSNPSEGETLVFSASASGGTAPYSFSWDLGDGIRHSGISTTHSYSRVGSYTVILTATDSGGQTAFMERTVSVAPAGSVPPSLPPLPEQYLLLFVVGTLIGMIVVLAALNLRTRSRLRSLRG